MSQGSKALRKVARSGEGEGNESEVTRQVKLKERKEKNQDKNANGNSWSRMRRTATTSVTVESNKPLFDIFILFFGGNSGSGSVPEGGEGRQCEREQRKKQENKQMGINERGYFATKELG